MTAPPRRATGALSPYPGSPMQTAYDAWASHARRCTECWTAGTAAATDCQSGRDMWQSYTGARVTAGYGPPQ